MRDFLRNHQLTREITISFSGEMSDSLKKRTRQPKSEDRRSYRIDPRDPVSADLSHIIGSLLTEVSITNIHSERLGLKEIMMQEEETENA